MCAAFPINALSKPSEKRPVSSAVPAAVLVLLRAEGLIELALAASAYRYVGGTWLMFALLFLAPDVGMAGYLANPRVGAGVYNGSHTYLGPALLASGGVVMSIPLLYLLALIWAAHIGFDRSLGYGLKYPGAFGATHLGWRGPRNFANSSEA
jgi:hypothetical protein